MTAASPQPEYSPATRNPAELAGALDLNQWAGELEEFAREIAAELARIGTELGAADARTAFALLRPAEPEAVRTAGTESVKQETHSPPVPRRNSIQERLARLGSVDAPASSPGRVTNHLAGGLDDE